MIAELSRGWGGALPMPGGLLEQPLGIVVAGNALANYAEAFRVERASDRANPCAPAVRELVARVRAMSALAGEGA